MPPDRSPISLALAGGAMAGAFYDFGAVCGLEAGLPEWRPARADRIVGTSAGAVVGAVLALGVDADSAALGLLKGGKHPLRFGRRDFYGMPWTERSPLFSGAFSNAGLERYIQRVAAWAGCPDRFDSLRAPLSVVATDLDTGDRVVFGPEGNDLPPVSRAVRASAAIPATFQPVRVGERDLVDGQLLDPIHLDLAAGPTTRAVFAVSSLVLYRREDPGPRVASMRFTAVLDQTARVSAAVKYAASLPAFQARHPDVVVFCIEPEPKDVPILLRAGFGQAGLAQAWGLGVKAAFRMLTARKHDLEPLAGPVTPDTLPALARRYGGEIPVL
jgi:NTE family protein